MQAELRAILDTLLSDAHGAWQMNHDGSYTLLAGKDTSVSSQQALIQKAVNRHREATRLKRRKPQGAKRRNIRH